MEQTQTGGLPLGAPAPTTPEAHPPSTGSQNTEIRQSEVEVSTEVPVVGVVGTVGGDPLMMLKLYNQYQKKKVKCAEYMKQWRKEHREEWNAKQREMYAKKKAEGTLPPSRQRRGANARPENTE